MPFQRNITQVLQKFPIPWRHLKCQSVEQVLLSSSPLHLRSSVHGFLLRCHRQRPRGEPGPQPCFVGSRSEGWSPSPGCPFTSMQQFWGSQSLGFLGLELHLPLQAVLCNFSLSLWPASASVHFTCWPPTLFRKRFLLNQPCPLPE